MGRVYCEACGANWRSSGDGPEAQEHHVDVPCVGESTEFKQRAEIAALIEKLRAVEAVISLVAAEWDEAMDLYQDTLAEAERGLSALRAELERKDAALKEALEFLPTEGEMRDEASLNEGRASRAGIVGAHVRAALQPKEPPCQTA